jgi:hypothetical protein
MLFGTTPFPPNPPAKSDVDNKSLMLRITEGQVWSKFDS